ncbi:MAG: hypothetical protein NTW94_08105 [Legionellales bacterium]|nr:hypothetical protein [Legionellales bacterium]
MKICQRQSLVLILLGLVFVAPGLSAYFFYKHPSLLQAPSTNKGELLLPPISIGEGSTLNPISRPKWRLILWSPAACQADCIEQLDKLARIRLALGRRLYEVVPELLLGTEAPPLPTALQKMLSERDIQVKVLSKSLRGDQSIFKKKLIMLIASPADFLVLAYPPLVKPEDVFHDIKQLLDTTQKTG